MEIKQTRFEDTLFNKWWYFETIARQQWKNIYLQDFSIFQSPMWTTVNEQYQVLRRIKFL